MPQIPDYDLKEQIKQGDLLVVFDEETGKTQNLDPGVIPRVNLVSQLPVTDVLEAQQYYLSKGRKAGQTTGNGTGILVIFDPAIGWTGVHSEVAPTD